jgi:predicted 3-demethylubiquinone-9 3-methyltransferase (glyoxalase superfamily)
MQQISTCLWFDSQAEEAAKFYMSIFRDSKVISTLRCGDAGPGPKGSVLVITFELNGQEIIALNGGSHFTLTPAVSLFVKCKTQEEIDTYWDKLLAGGEPSHCGWLTDKFGLSWQIVPTVLVEMLQDKDAAKAARVMEALMKMIKLDIAALKRAYDGA